MTTRDIFSKYTQIYRKSRAREIIPPGPFVRQFVDLPTQELDVGIFFKSRGEKNPRQIYIGHPIHPEISKHEGLLEVENKTYLSRTILRDFKGLQYLRVVISAGELLEDPRERIAFLKKCQRLIDVLLRKAKNIIHTGDFSPFRFDKKVKSLEKFLRKTLQLDDVTIEAAMIPFQMAKPDYVILTDNDIIVIDYDFAFRHGVYYLVGGIGYVFDKTAGAIQEERLFRTSADWSEIGIDEGYIQTMLANVTSDFQNNVHSLLFADLWRKSKAQPIAVVYGGLMLKIGDQSDVWSGVFEIYIRQP